MILRLQTLFAQVILSCCLLGVLPVTMKAAVAEVVPPPAWSINPANFQFRMDMVIRIRYQGVPSNDANNIIGVFVGSELRGVATPINLGGERYFFTTIYSNSYTGETIRFRAYYAPDDQVYGSPDMFTFTNYAIIGSIADPFWIDIDPNFDFPPEIQPILADTTIQTIPFAPKGLAAHLVSQDGDPVTWSALPGSNLTATIVNDSLFVNAVSPAWTGTDSVRIIATENTPGQLADTIYALFTVLPDYGAPMWGTIPGQTIFGGGTFTSFDLDNYLTFNGPCRAFDLDVFPFTGSDPNPNWPSVAPSPLPMTIVARPEFVDIPLAGPGAVLAAFVNGTLAATATPVGTLPDVTYSLQLQDVGPGAISFQFYHAEKQYLYNVSSPLTFSAGAAVGSLAAPFKVQLSPITPILAADGGVQLQVNDTTWRGSFPIDFIVWDCDYPALRRDTTTATYIIQDNNYPLITSTSTVNFQENSCLELYDTQTSDPNDSEGNGLTYAIVGGADSGKFYIDPLTGKLFWDNFNPDFDNPGDFNGDNKYEVKIRVTNTLNLTDEITLIVTVTQDPDGTFNPQLVGSAGFCIAGGSALLQASGGTTYLWSTGATTSSISVTAAGIYFVTVTDGVGCSAVLSTPLSVAPTITASGNSGLVCVGTSIMLSSLPTGGSGTYTAFSWMGPNNFSSGIQNPAAFIATSAASGTYTVMVTDDAGCTATATVTVNVSSNSAPGISATGSTPVCVGQNIDLNSVAFGGSGVFTNYLWSGPNNYQSNLGNPLAFTATSVSASGLYYVTVTDNQGCTGTSVLNITVNPVPSITAAGNGPLCVGGTVVLSSSPSGGTLPYNSFAWSGPNSYMANVEDPASFAASLAGSGAYSVTVTDNNGCSASSTANVSITGVPSISAMAVGPTCEGGTVTLASTPSGGSGTYASFTWSGPNSFAATVEDPAPIPAIAAAGGTYNVTVTDNAGCSATASASISIHPVPAITAQSNSPVCENANLVLSSTPSGGSGVYSLFNWTGPDNYVASAQNPVGFSSTLASDGVYQVKVTDNRGCTATATTSVTVVPKPNAVAANNGPACIGTLVHLTVNVTGGSGVFSSFSWTGPDTYSSNMQNPTAFPATLMKAGTYRVTVTDNVGCTSTSSTTLAVSSNIAPTITATSNTPLCVGATLQLNSTPMGGGGTYTYAWSGPSGYTANIKNPTRAAVTAAAAGAYIVTVTDNNNCKNTASTSVQISEVVATASTSGSCQDATITLTSSATGGSGVYTSYSWSGPNGFTSPMQNPTPFPRIPAAQGIYTVTITDNAGCTDTDTTFVQVLDNQPPTIACPGAQTIATSTLNCSGTLGNWTSFASNLTDDCTQSGNISVTQSPAAATVLTGHNTTQTVTLTATDQSNNAATCSFVVTLKDQTPPNIVCPANNTVAADDNCNGSLGAWSPASVSDNCNPASVVTQSPLAATVLSGHNAAQTVTFTANDGNGNSSTCSFIITLKDITPPSIQCPADQTLSADANCSSPLGTWNAEAVSDNCAQPGSITVNQSPLAGTSLNGHDDFEIVTLTAADGNGNQANCTFKVTLKDVTPPSITCPPNITVACATAVPPIDTNLVVASDNCSPVTRTSLGFNISNLECANRFKITRAYRADDLYGNASTCTHTITVRDTIAPVFTFVPANLTVQCNAVPTAVGNCLAVDNCNGALTIVYEGQVRTDGNCLDTYVLTRTWRATDVCGNSRTATQRIVVRDTTKPNFTGVPANITVTCDAVPPPGMPGAIDNCDLDVSVVYDGETRTNGACLDSYTLVRKWTATDNCGNTRTATHRITVRDLQKPTITNMPPNLTLECFEDLPPVVAPTVVDNCDQSVTVTYLGQNTVNLVCQNICNVLRTWIATDNCGNSIIATQTFVVQDTFVPVFTFVPPSVTLECNVPVPFPGTPTAEDNCSGAAFVQILFLGEVRTDGNCSNNYTLTRTWRATDLCGNSITASQVITVADTQAPLFTSPPANITVNCSGIPIVPAVQAQDSCSAAQVTYVGQNQTPGDCNTGFVITRTWRATDACGNMRTHTQTIVVVSDMLTPPLEDRQQASNNRPSLDISLIPNPAFSSASVRFGLESDAEVRIVVCDLSGKVVHVRTYLAAAGDHVYQLELESLPGGVYLVQVQAGDQRDVEKLIVLER